MVDWAEGTRYGLVFDALSGGLFLVLGIVILFVRPRRRIPTVFGLFAVGFGLTYIFLNLSRQPLELLDPNWGVISVLGAVVSGAMAIALAFGFPLGAPRPRARQAILPAMAALLFFVSFMTGVWEHAGLFQAAALPLETQRFFTAGVMFQLAALAFTSTMWAARIPDLAKAIPTERVRQLLVASLALFLYGVLQGGMMVAGMPAFHAMGIPWRALLPMTLSGVPSALLWIGLLLRATHETRAPVARWCRDGAVAVAAALAAGALFAAATEPAVASDLGLLGSARAIGFVVVAYMVLRNQFLGADVVFKFTVKQSTVAAIFVSVFFFVETLASEWLSDRFGLWLGVASTAVLVFAIHPLQRLGHRVADAAMPGVRPLADRTDEERTGMYEDLVKEAWADGALSRAEGRVLEVARVRLGLSIEQAHHIEAKRRN